jgi:hypothetical protein
MLLRRQPYPKSTCAQIALFSQSTVAADTAINKLHVQDDQST